MIDSIKQLSDFIRDEIGYEGHFDPEMDLFDEKILDSFSVVEMAAFIQSVLQVSLKGEDLVRENFSSLNNIAALIEKRSRPDTLHE